MEIVCLKNPDSIILNIDSSTLLDLSHALSLFDKSPSSDNKEARSRNGYHGKIMLEAHGATVTVSLDEETRLLNISAHFPQKEDFNPYPE